MQSTVQPPFGQPMPQELLPPQVTVEPAPRSTLQALPPLHSTVLFVPAESVHELAPAQLEVQFEPQLPAHSDFPSQVAVQPEPHVRSQLVFESQWYVTSLGGGEGLPTTMGAASAPASRRVVPSPPPRTHLPPAVHVQVFPLQAQSPAHVAVPSAAPSLDPQPGVPSATRPTTNPARKSPIPRVVIPVRGSRWAIF